jgi:hypothetical protein
MPAAQPVGVQLDIDEANIAACLGRERVVLMGCGVRFMIQDMETSFAYYLDASRRCRLVHCS